MEIFSWVARVQTHPLARARQTRVLELQRHLFSTAEPSTEQLFAVANAARDARPELERTAT